MNEEEDQITEKTTNKLHQQQQQQGKFDCCCCCCWCCSRVNETLTAGHFTNFHCPYHTHQYHHQQQQQDDIHQLNLYHSNHQSLFTCTTTINASSTIVNYQCNSKSVNLFKSNDVVDHNDHHLTSSVPEQHQPEKRTSKLLSFCSTFCWLFYLILPSSYLSIKTSTRQSNKITMENKMTTRKITRHLSSYYYWSWWWKWFCQCCCSRNRSNNNNNNKNPINRNNNRNNNGRILLYFPFIILLLLLFNDIFSTIKIIGVNCLDSLNDLDQIQITSLCDRQGIMALGMESGAIPDSALTASSTYNNQSVGPQNARLNRELNGGAWCPASQIGNDNSGHEWIQINLTEPYVITKIATQGRFGNGMGVEYVEMFWLDYTRDNGQKWTRWRNQIGDYNIVGNGDTYSIVENILPIPLVGVTAIRILPVSYETRTCCLRFELFGCPYKDGPISYTMIDGEYSGPFGDLIDHTYDGYRSETGLLSGGLGQLIDGIKGYDDYKTNKGFEWIGWRRTSLPNSLLSITFHFNEIRNFTRSTFHCHNMFNNDIQVFHSAKIRFSRDGRQWISIPDFEYMPDLMLPKARDVIIHLHHGIGRFIRFDLHFASKWLLISEVSFESQPANPGLSMNESIIKFDFVDIGPITTTRSIYNDLPIVFIILAAIIGFLLITFVAMLICLARKRKEKITGSEYTTVPMKDVSPTPLYCEPNDFTNNPMATTIRLSSPYCSNNDPEYAVPDLLGNGTTTGTLIGPTTTFLTAENISKPNGNLFQHPSPALFIKQRNWQINNNNNTTNSSSNCNNNVPKTNNKIIPDDDDGKARYYASTDVLLRNNLEQSSNNPPATTNTNNNTNNIAVVGIPTILTNGFGPGVGHIGVGLNGKPSNIRNQSTIIPSSSFIPNISSNTLSHHESPPSSLSSNTSKILKLNSSTHSTSLESYTPENTPIHSGKSVSPIPIVPPTATTTIQNHHQQIVPLLKDKDISIIDGHFGYSKFGDCELGYFSLRKNDKKLVVLQTLTNNGNDNNNMKEEFLKEMNEKWQLSQKCGDTFARLFGYITKYDYMAMVIEYGDMDLKKFLKSSSPSTIGFVQLIKISIQIAEAMNELNLRGFIHRDLAARNCLIYLNNLKIKITDSSGSFNKEYRKSEYFNETFPIRWMSYESILKGIFTIKSNVYSFGVTLWEIMKYCQSIPHHLLNDEEFLNEIYNEENTIKNSDSLSSSSSAYYNHPFNNDLNQSNNSRGLLRLPNPSKDCPDEIYDLILECTQRSEISRPEFSEIIYFLRKNLEFS